MGDLCEEDEALMETHLGEFDLYEDEIANEEFGMDYDQLGSNEKEWVRDEIDNMEMRESLDESKYEKEETIQQTIDRLKARIDDSNDGGNVPFLIQKIKDLEKSLEEAYSGFRRGEPEDPDSEPFNPTGSVAEFKEDLRALFGKFKGDLKNPEFIKGIAQIMVSWKSLLRSQLDEAK